MALVLEGDIFELNTVVGCTRAQSLGFSRWQGLHERRALVTLEPCGSSTLIRRARFWINTDGRRTITSYGVLCTGARTSPALVRVRVEINRYPEKYCVDLREPPRSRADAVTATISRQWRGAPEI